MKLKGDKLNGGVDVHFFSAEANVRDLNNEIMNASLGTELDAYCSFDIAKGVKTKLGYSHLFGTETLEAIQGGDKNQTANWAWLMITVKPQFIKGKLK